MQNKNFIKRAMKGVFERFNGIFVQLRKRIANHSLTADYATQNTSKKVALSRIASVRFASALFLLLTLCVGNAWGDEYTYTDFTVKFTKGTTNGTNISTGITGGSTYVSTISSEGSENYASKVTASSASWYSTSGCALRLSSSSNTGYVQFTLNDALKDSTIYAIVVYASKISGNTKANLKVTPAGGYTTATTYANASLPTYNTSYPSTTNLSNYKLDTIKVGGKKLTTLKFECTTSKGYTMLHAITVVTQTEKAASCSSEITITKGTNPANGTFTINNSGTVCIDEGNASTTVTATPSSHYHLATVTSTGGGSVGAISNNTCTVSNISANTTINVTFEADPTYTVTWVAGSNPSFSTQTNYSGTALTDPGTPSAASYCPGGKVFVGWTATPIVGEGEEPADLFTSVSGKSIPVGGTTYYAVFATEGEGGDVVDVINRALVVGANSNIGSNNNTTWATATVDGSSSGAQYYVRSMGLNGATNYAMRWNSNGYLYCKTAPTSGYKLKSITVTTTSTKAVALYASTSKYSSAATSTSLGSNLSATTSGATYALTSAQLANNYTCVGINGTESSTEIVSISITYSGGTSYSNYATSCCTELDAINGSFNCIQLHYDLYYYVIAFI